MQVLFSALLLFTSFLWGGNFVVSKLLVGHASDMTLTNLRWIIAVAVLLPIVFWREKKLLPPRRALLPLLMMGLTGVVFFNLFMFQALEHTTATNVGLLSTLNPVSIAIFSFLLLREKIHPLQIGCMLISLAGVLVVLCKGEIGRLLQLEFNKGDLWMLAAVAMWGLYSVASKWAMRDVSPIKSTLFSGLFGVLILLPFNATSFTITDGTPAFWSGVLYVGLLSTVVGMLLWNIGVKRIGGTAAGMFLNFNPIFTAVLAVCFLGEQMTWLQAAGTALVITGVVLFNRVPVLLRKRVPA